MNDLQASAAPGIPAFRSRIRYSPMVALAARGNPTRVKLSTALEMSRILHIKSGPLGLYSNPKSLLTNVLQSVLSFPFLPFLSFPHRPSTMRAFLLIPIALAAVGRSFLRIYRAERP